MRTCQREPVACKAQSIPRQQLVSGNTIREAKGLSAPLPPLHQSLTFYTHTLCPYAQRVWLTLLEKEVSHNLLHVDLSCKPAWFSRVSPSGLVPVVQLENTTVSESIDICRWLDGECLGPSLHPADDRHIERVERIINAASGFVSAGMDMLAGSTSGPWGIGSQHSSAQQRRFEDELQQLAEAIDISGGPYLTGSRPTLADMVMYPFIERFVVAMPAFCGFHPRSAVSGNIGQYQDAMMRRSSVQACAANEELLLKEYRQSRRLDFFDYKAYSAMQLHPHLKSHALYYTD